MSLVAKRSVARNLDRCFAMPPARCANAQHDISSIFARGLMSSQTDSTSA